MDNRQIDESVYKHRSTEDKRIVDLTLVCIHYVLLTVFEYFQ